MSDASKFLWTALGVLIAGIVGYWVASYAVSDLNKRVLDAAQSLGKIQAQTERIEKDNTDLLAKAKELTERNKRVEIDIKEAEVRLAGVTKSDVGKLVAAIQVLNESPDVKSLALKVQSLEADISKQALPVLTSSQEGCVLFAGRKLQICWGSQELPPESHIRKFNIKFPQPFAIPPTVVPGINTHSDGQAPAIYQFEIKEASYVGAVNNMNEPGRMQTGKVILNYVAIGAPRS